MIQLGDPWDKLSKVQGCGFRFRAMRQRPTRRARVLCLHAKGQGARGGGPLPGRGYVPIKLHQEFLHGNYWWSIFWLYNTHIYIIIYILHIQSYIYTHSRSIISPLTPPSSASFRAVLRRLPWSRRPWPSNGKMRQGTCDLAIFDEFFGIELDDGKIHRKPL
jgi:hypothetical protein